MIELKHKTTCSNSSRQRHCVHVSIIVILFIALVGPLALLYGVDSRLDDRRR